MKIWVAHVYDDEEKLVDIEYATTRDLVKRETAKRLRERWEDGWIEAETIPDDDEAVFSAFFNADFEVDIGEIEVVEGEAPRSPETVSIAFSEREREALSVLVGKTLTRAVERIEAGLTVEEVNGLVEKLSQRG